ncbi:MAG: hypothetical protein H0U84_01650 [Thermoleophilaceae bacterium]|nr:hypothetical protein [Thermoleophilaceae bacterium]
MAGGERCRDGVERMGKGTGDRAALQILGAQLDIGRVALEPLVVRGADAPAENVHGLAFPPKPGGQLLRYEHVRAVDDLEGSADRVVVGDRDEVHAAALGQLIDLLRRSGAFGQPERALHPEARLL